MSVVLAMTVKERSLPGLPELWGLYPSWWDGGLCSPLWGEREGQNIPLCGGAAEVPFESGHSWTWDPSFAEQLAEAEPRWDWRDLCRSLMGGDVRTLTLILGEMCARRDGDVSQRRPRKS